MFSYGSSVKSSVNRQRVPLSPSKNDKIEEANLIGNGCPSSESTNIELYTCTHSNGKWIFHGSLTFDKALLFDRYPTKLPVAVSIENYPCEKIILYSAYSIEFYLYIQWKFIVSFIRKTLMQYQVSIVLNFFFLFHLAYIWT